MSSSRGAQLLSSLFLPLRDMALARGRECQRHTPAPRREAAQNRPGALAVFTPSLRGFPAGLPSGCSSPCLSGQGSLTVTCFQFSRQVTFNQACRGEHQARHLRCCWQERRGRAPGCSQDRVLSHRSAAAKAEGGSLWGPGPDPEKPAPGLELKRNHAAQSWKGPARPASPPPASTGTLLHARQFLLLHTSRHRGLAPFIPPVPSKAI